MRYFHRNWIEVKRQFQDRFTCGERPLFSHRTGGWLSPRAELDPVGKRNILPVSGFKPINCNEI
jgi:hypothetical protein